MKMRKTVTENGDLAVDGKPNKMRLEKVDVE